MMIRKIATAAACAAAFLLTSAVPSAKIYAEEPAAQDTIKVYEISMSDLDPIDTLKRMVIPQRALTDDAVAMENVNMQASVLYADGLDRTKAGLQSVNVRVNLTVTDAEGKESIYSFSEPIVVKMIKETAPQLKLKSDTVVVNNGDVFNPTSYILYIHDDSSVLPVLTETDNVDMSTDGDYKAVYTAVDQDGNKTVKTLHVIVKTHDEVIAAREEAERLEALSLQYAMATVANGMYSPGMSPYNPYSGGWSNCVYGAWQAVYDHLGIMLPGFGNAGSWLYAAQAYGYATGSYPAIGAVAVYSGHVAYVANVSSDGSMVYIIEGGYLGHYNERWVSASGTGTQHCQGYIYLR